MEYVVADIHGNERRFNSIMKQIDLQHEDTLYVLGDVIDRHPGGIRILRRIMAMPNAKMLLGNHEYMMLQCYRERPSGFDCFRWGRNGNASTIDAFRRLAAKEQKAILQYLQGLPTHIEICVDGIPYYLVHGFPSDCAEDEVWERPELYAQNPKPGYRVIIGHTPVLNLVVPREERQAYIRLLEAEKDHPRILFSRGFIDVDCGCSYADSMKTLGCLRLDDLSEFYVHNSRDTLEVNAALQKRII